MNALTVTTGVSFARFVYPTYRLNRDAGCTHEAIVEAVETAFGGPAPEHTWDAVQRWYESTVRQSWDRERENIRSAYVAMRSLRYEQTPACVRSWVGMVRLLEAIFYGYPPTNRQLRIKNNPSPIKVRWSWPAEQVARAHEARAWL
jgi:hypothetical protein